VSHKRTTQNNGKSLNDGIWAEYKEIKQYVLMTNWTTGPSNANKAQKIFMPIGCSNSGINVSAHGATKIVKLHPYKITAIKHSPPNGKAV